MNNLTEAQFRVLCDLRHGRSWLPAARGDTVAFLEEEGLICFLEEDRCWTLTESGRDFVDGKGRDLSMPGFGALTAAEKRVILEEETFPESDRRRLLSDSIRTVVLCAISCLGLTEEEFIRLGDSPYPAVRAAALDRGACHLRDGKELERKLSRYLEHDDKATIGAILAALSVTGNIGFVDANLVEHWFRSGIPDADLLGMLCKRRITVPDGTLVTLFAKHDPAVFAVMSEFLLDRLDPAQVDTILAEGNTEARAIIAAEGRNLTAVQIQRLEADDDDRVRRIIHLRLENLAQAMTAVEDDPELVRRIRAEHLPKPSE